MRSNRRSFTHIIVQLKADDDMYIIRYLEATKTKIRQRLGPMADAVIGRETLQRDNGSASARSARWVCNNRVH